MTLSPRLFRQAILVAIAISLVGLVFELAFPGLIPPDVRAAHEKEDADADVARMLLICLIWLIDAVVTVVVTVGLYRFRPWARKWNLYLVALSLPLCASLGYMVLSGLAYGLYAIASMIWGALTFATYFSDLSTRFDSPAPSSDVAP